MAQSKVCKNPNCGKVFYRKDNWNDKTWRTTRHCNYRCKYQEKQKVKPHEINFISMKLSVKKYQPSAVF